jgi:cytochrome c2
MISKVSTEHINWPRVTGEELSSLAEFIKNFSTEPVSKKLFSPAGSPMEGRKIFQKFSCNRCHSEQNFDVVAGKNVLEISAEMWNNGPKMWTKMLEVGYNIPEFTPEDFINLTSYLYFIQYPWKRGNSMEGKKIFEKNCAQCHTEGPGPSIKKIKGKYDHLGFILAIWNHTENMHDIAKEKGITWPRFLSYEMNHLVEYMTEK